MGITLHEVSGEYMRLMDEADAIAEENEGIIPDTLSDKIDALGETRTNKIKNCVHFFKNLSAEADAIKNEKDALAAREKSLRRKADWFEGYIRYNVREGELFSAPTYAIKWRASSAVEITNLDKVPLSLCKEIIKEPVKNLIKQAEKDGEDISEYAVIVHKKNMQIK
jgi:hypothetical protein